MRTTFAGAVCAFVLATTGLAFAEQPSPPPTPSPYLIARMGIETPERDALGGIGFRPFVPSHRPAVVALLAPFKGADTAQNRGIGYEYAGDRGKMYALAQWPSNGGSISGFPGMSLGEAGCPDVHAFGGTKSKPRGLVWTTPRGLVFTLQPDGAPDPRNVEAEWRRLVRRGACR
jgi:hypothetical protein